MSSRSAGVATPDRASPFTGRVALASLSNLVLPITAVVTGPLLARSLGPEGRGEMSAVISPLYVAVYLASAALPDAATFFIARHPNLARSITERTVTVAMFGSVAAATALVAFAPLLLEDNESWIRFFRLLCIVIPPSCAVVVLRAAAFGSGNVAAVAAERVTSSLTRLAALLLLAWFGELDVETACIVQAVTSFFPGGIILLRARAANPRLADDVMPSWQALTWYGVRGWPAVVASLINLRLDQALLLPLIGARDLGLYAAAVTLAELPLFLVAGLTTVTFAEATARQDPGFVPRACRCVVLLACAAALGGLLFAPIIIDVLFGGGYSGSVPLARVLLLATIPYAITEAIGAGFLANGRPGLLSISRGIAVIVTLAGLYALVPAVGVIGAAWTSAGAYAVAAIAAVFLYTRTTTSSVRALLTPTVSDARWLLRTARAYLP